MEDNLSKNDHRHLALMYVDRAHKRGTQRGDKRWPAAASPKDKDRWLADMNQRINEGLALAQIHATLAITAKDDEPKQKQKQKSEPDFSGLTDLIDYDKLVKFFRGEK